MYKKASKTDLQEVNCEASKIAKKERFENKMEIFTPSEAYLTIKDHKCDFLRNILWRLINPAKMDVGKLSRTILQEKIAKLHEKLQLNQWKSTDEVLEWFSTLKFTKASTKNQKTKFFKFNIQAYYSSDMLKKLIQFAKTSGVFISECDISIIKAARKASSSKMEFCMLEKEETTVLMWRWGHGTVRKLRSCAAYTY